VELPLTWKKNEHRQIDLNTLLTKVNVLLMFVAVIVELRR